MDGIKNYFTTFGNITLLFQVYVAAIVGLEGGVGNIVSRSLIARLVPQDELGKIYGLLAILDASLPFADNFLTFFICLIFIISCKATL